MESKFTKGKWYVDNSNPFVIWHPTIIGEQIASLPNLIQLEGAEHGLLAKYSKDEALANALLISKAPELLEMLEILANSNPIHDGFHEKKLKAIELIKSATEI